MFIPVPQGNSISSHQQLQKTVSSCVAWCAADDLEADRECAEAVLCGLESQFPNEFLDIVHYCGYSTQKAVKISAAFWTAMSTEAGFLVTQQRILNRYLTNHFGARVCVPELEIMKFTSQFVPFQTEYKRFPDPPHRDKRVLYSWKDLSIVIEFYLDTILGNNPDDIYKIEICLGGDHGKGKFTFTALVIIRYKQPIGNKEKKPNILEFQIGQIDC